MRALANGGTSWLRQEDLPEAPRTGVRRSERGGESRPGNTISPPQARQESLAAPQTSHTIVSPSPTFVKLEANRYVLRDLHQRGTQRKREPSGVRPQKLSQCSGREFPDLHNTLGQRPRHVKRLWQDSISNLSETLSRSVLPTPAFFYTRSITSTNQGRALASGRAGGYPSRGARAAASLSIAARPSFSAVACNAPSSWSLRAENSSSTRRVTTGKASRSFRSPFR
jgi:hypothetical protein